ncbi:hypothetical protein [Clostridium pasteurianum]|uniref:Uncharacterized protein n=1 Tax=Clostridium pasteurianum BC1 TaxID=86416 RepID=R4K785_CLOPA|nr:hypothetical protein [Clostridium pasteurianum]AGK99017.1 hypothetical protein Clopa_4298 [Clostridium pasteurianum BC1]
MAKISANDMYKNRIEQINHDLQQEYYKGKRKSKNKIKKLSEEKERLEKLVRW